ncbi:sporulation protein Cse60 [Bacillus timonensis]|nr:sporulation protein Cse60 [Bacillus timonensis]
MRCRVKVFDENHEMDLEHEINLFLEELEPANLIDIKYQVSISNNANDDQIYCFSAMIIYRR